jgi:hypothetical protein
LKYRHERNRDHGEAYGALRRRVRQFRRFRDKCHHDQIWANDGDVLKPEPQEMGPGWYLVQRIYQLHRPFSDADFPRFGFHLRYSG